MSEPQIVRTTNTRENTDMGIAAQSQQPNIGTNTNMCIGTLTEHTWKKGVSNPKTLAD